MIVHYTVKTALIITTQQIEAEALEGVLATAGVQTRALWGAVVTAKKVAGYLESGEYDALILSPCHTAPSGKSFILPSQQRIQVDQLLKDLTRPPIFVALLACNTSSIGDRFYRWGARLVLATRSDEALARSYTPLVSSFLEAGLSGMTAGDALRFAQARLQHDDPQDYSYRLFTLIGDTDSRMMAYPGPADQAASQANVGAQEWIARKPRTYAHSRHTPSILADVSNLYTILFSSAAYDRLQRLSQTMPLEPMSVVADSSMSTEGPSEGPQCPPGLTVAGAREPDQIERGLTPEPVAHVFQVIPQIEQDSIEIGDWLSHHEVAVHEQARQIEIASEDPATVLDELNQLVCERERLVRWWLRLRRSGWGCAEWRSLAYCGSPSVPTL